MFEIVDTESKQPKPGWQPGNPPQFGVNQMYEDGHDLLHALRTDRKERANDLRKWRDEITRTLPKLTLKRRNMFVARMVPRCGTFRRVTFDALMSAAHGAMSHAVGPCPPLPCGADDAYIEGQQYSRDFALCAFEAAHILRAERDNAEAPNLHAFDERWLNGED